MKAPTAPPEKPAGKKRLGLAVRLGLLFLAVGLVSSWLATQFEKFPTVGIAMLFLFVIFETAFFCFALAVGKHVLGTLGLWTIAVANLLAASAMAGYL